MGRIGRIPDAPWLTCAVRFAEPWLLVLTSLSDGPKHGYAIMADVAAFSGVRMEPGTGRVRPP